MKRFIPIFICAFSLIALFSLVSCENAQEYYTVTFDTDGATKSVTTQVVKSGSTAIEPKDPVKEDTIFKEWTLDGKRYNFYTPVTKDITLKAVYAEYHTVTFLYNNTAPNKIIKVLDGTVLTRPSDPVKEGCSFIKWNRIDENTDVFYYDFTEPVTSDLKLWAVYDENLSTAYTITFDSQGATTTPAAQIITTGSCVIEPKEPTKTDTYFKMWVKVKEDGTESTTAYNFSEPVTETFTLKAVYYNTYTVTFWSSGGSFVRNDIQHIKEGATVEEPKSPTWDEKWGFKAWVTNASDASSVFDFNTPITSNLNLYATYYEKYTVTYKNPDGSVYETQAVKEGTTASNLEGPKKTGAWSFKHWALEGTTEAYNFTTKVTSDITLVPIYVNGYTVTFDSNGGTAVDSQFVEEGKTLVEPKAPDKESTRGFMWWTTKIGDYGNSSPYDFSTPVTSDLKLIAVYWPANLRLEDYSVYDNEIYAKYKEVRYLHYITKELVKLDKLMNKSTNVKDAFNITNNTDNSLVISLFTHAKMDPDHITFEDGTTVDTSNSDFTYTIKVDNSSIESNTTEVKTNSIGSSKYTIDISNLVLKVTFRYTTEKEETQEVKISVKGTFIKNSEDRYELHMKYTIDGKEYPVLHGSAILSPKEAGSSEYDNVLCFSYDGFTSYIPGIEM